MADTAEARRAERHIPGRRGASTVLHQPSQYIAGTFLGILIQHTKQAALNFSSFLPGVSKLVILSTCLVGRHNVCGSCNFSSLGFVHVLQSFLHLLLNPHSWKVVDITLKKEILGPT